MRCFSTLLCAHEVYVANVLEPEQGCITASVFGGWLAIDGTQLRANRFHCVCITQLMFARAPESETASKVRNALYHSPLGDAYKMLTVNIDEMTKNLTEPASDKLLEVTA